MDSKNKISDDVKRARHELRMSQAELADALGVTRQYINAVERGKLPASPKILDKMWAALDMSRQSESDPTIIMYKALPPDSRAHVAGIIRSLAGASA